MATTTTTTSCCSKLSPNLPPFSNPPPNPTQVKWPKKENKSCWKSRCLVGLTCAIVGIEMGNLTAAGGGYMEVAGANEIQRSVVQSNEKGQRWSDKRKCPPWQINSLETIVPENLPRPSAHRRWEAVGFSDHAPTVKVVTNKCFSM